MDQVSRESVWSHYWRQGPLHSLLGSYSGNYDGVVADFWEEVFCDVPGTTRMLDIGTGNGAIPALALGTPATPRKFDIHAADLSAIHPDWMLALSDERKARLHFHAGMSAESLMFPDGAFDLVTSQYGFEYTELADSVPELSRVLAVEGQVAFVLHHTGSRLFAVAQADAAHVTSLLAPAGAMEVGKSIYPFIASSTTPEGRRRLVSDPAASASKQRFNAMMGSLARAIEADPYPDALLDARHFMAGQIQALQRGLPLDAALHDHHSRVQAMRESAFRNAELCSHALSEAGVSSLVESLRRQGIRTDAPGLLHHENGMLLGWTLRGSKSRAD